MTTLTQYARPEWWIGVAGWPPDDDSTEAGRNRCIFYVKQLKVHMYGGDVGGSLNSEAFNFELDPPGEDEVLSQFRASNSGNYRLESGDEWWGFVSGAPSTQRYYPSDGDSAYLWGEGTRLYYEWQPWDYSNGLPITGSYPVKTNSNIRSGSSFPGYVHRIHMDLASDTRAYQWMTYTSQEAGKLTASNRGTFSSSNFTWTAGSGSSEKTTANWENEVRSVETDIAAAVAVNGRYPVYPATTETFGTYTASTNTYVAGAADALNADDWYTEFTQAVVALEAAIVRIGDLRDDLGDRVINRPEDEEELEPLEGPGPVPEQAHRESDVFAEPLIEFPKIEFSLEGIKEPEPPASDDVEVPGLLRVANFAKRTDSVSAFSRHTYSESSFSPRETVSPAFNKDEEE
ncbi:hypothetical protein [uncultured Mediterranean phage]|nr:hypothetical protein [uncultured Mediterranean phage]